MKADYMNLFCKAGMSQIYLSILNSKTNKIEKLKGLFSEQRERETLVDFPWSTFSIKIKMELKGCTRSNSVSQSNEIQ